jgi:drug/metabolite transporter (DMT)-like permease
MTTSLVPPRSFTPRDTALLLSLGGMWGLSFLFIEVALRGLSPLWIVSGRTVVGALFLLVVLQVTRRPLPRGTRLWVHLTVLGVLSNAAPWLAVAWAQQAIPSGLAALLMALVPSSTLLVSAGVGLERITRPKVVGLLLALAGVAATVAGDLADPSRVVAVVTVVLATVAYAAGAVYAKRYVSGIAAPVTVATGQVVTAAVVSTAAAVLFAPRPAADDLAPTVVGATIALGVFGTGAAFYLFYVLVARVGATNTTLVTYLIPLVAVVAGAIVLDERLGPGALAGGVLIGAGIWLAQRATRPPTDAEGVGPAA